MEKLTLTVKEINRIYGIPISTIYYRIKREYYKIADNGEIFLSNIFEYKQYNMPNRKKRGANNENK